MIIDKEQLISLLIDKTGLKAEEVESQLSELINRIQEAAEKGKTFEIEGFGAFSMEEGNLQFEPSDTLETEINNKYAGMKPIELIGAFKEPEGDEVPDMSEEELEESDGRWAFDESAIEEGSEEPVAEKNDSEKAEELVAQFENKQKESYSSEEESEENVNKVFGTEQPEEQSDPMESDEEQPSQQEQTALQVANAEDETEEDPIGRLLVAAVVVLALGVGGWLIYDAGFVGSSNTGQRMPEQTTQQAQIPAQQTGDTQPETSQESSFSETGNTETSEPEKEKPVVNQEGSSTETGTQQQNRFGLKGEFNQTVGGYTIVVHSLRSMRRAENNRQDLERAGFRTLINKADINGTTYYRIGIGQFKTVEDAQQATSQLPELYRENNFIKRIR
jgi:nucleoid DNA-binding protein/cell division protein FtsN